MKKHKSVISILLAIMMIFTFMPTLAFADSASTIATGHHTWALGTHGETDEYGDYWVDSTYEGLKVIVAPTCTMDGVGEIYCQTKLNDEACGAVKTVHINSLGHKQGRKIRLTADKLMTYLNYSDAQKQAFYANASEEFCEGYVYVCDNCGLYLDESGNVVRRLSQVFDKTAHTPPAGTKACAASFTCSVCGVAKRTDSTHNAQTSATEHSDWSKVDSSGVKVHKSDNTDNPAKYVQVTKYTCSVCGETWYDDGDKAVVVGYASKDDIKHGATKRITEREATCSKNGQYTDLCTECGMVVGAGEIEALAHTYRTVGPVVISDIPEQIRSEAIAGSDVYYTYEECAVCLAPKKGSVKAVGFTPQSESSLTFAVVAPANCEQGPWLSVSYKFGNEAFIEYVSDKEIEDEIADGWIREVGGKYYARFGEDKNVEVPYAKAAGHKFGNLTSVAAETCTKTGLDAKVCEVCGKVDHETVVNVGKALGHEVEEVTVDPTCGEGGYTYKACTRCGEYLDQNGKTAAELNPEAKPFKEPQKYNETKSIKTPGTKCSYEWQDLEPATAFKKGTRAKVCTECGHIEEATKESIAKKTIAAPKVKALKKKAKVTVKAVEGATKYQILVNGKVSKTVTKAGTFTVKKAIKASKKGTKNKFQIRAINADGVKATSKAKSVKIKK